MATFGPWAERQETVQYERLNMMYRDDQALVLVHEAARIRATSLIYDIEFVQRLQVAGDVIVMLRAYWDTSQAVAAFRGNMPARLLDAAKQGTREEAELVLPFGANPNQADPVSTESALMIAAAADQVEMVKMLLAYGAEPNLINRKSGTSALHNACRAGKPGPIKALVGADAFVNLQRPTTGETPLHEALRNGFPECAEILIEAGASKDLRRQAPCRRCGRGPGSECTEEEDLNVLEFGIRYARELVQASAFDEFRGVEIAPGAAVTGKSELRDYIRTYCGTVWHPVGTCKMGSDPESVVDDQLKVHGVEGLRVVDASIMPHIVNGNPNAAIMMIAEKAADLIRGDQAPTLIPGSDQ